MAFTFSKHQAIIEKPANMPDPGPYYTSLVDMREIEHFPYAYALFFSTDHHGGEGGLWVYFCNDAPADGPWISYDDAVAAGAFDYLSEKPAGNPIFIDTVQGNGHTETPHVQAIDGKVYLTYHKNGIEGTQMTILAIADDGINYKRLNGDDDSIVLRYDNKIGPGEGHTGYFRWAPNPFDGVDKKYIGYSLHGGGDDYHSAFWTSDDAINWQRDEVLIPIEGQALNVDDQMIVWHEMDPSSIRRLDNGDYVGICGVGNRASGAAARIVELYAVFLGPDGRTLKQPSVKLLSVGESASADAEELTSPVTIEYNGELQLIYVGAAQSGTVNTILTAKGSFDPSYQGEVLDAETQTKHFYQY